MGVQWVATSYVYCAMRLVELSVCTRVHVRMVRRCTHVLSLCAPSSYILYVCSKHDEARDEYTCVIMSTHVCMYRYVYVMNEGT